MDRFIVTKKSLGHIVEITVAKNKSVRLFRQQWLKWSFSPISVRLYSKKFIEVKLWVEVRFGLDVLKTVDQLNHEIQANLGKIAQIAVKSCRIWVKGVYDDAEKENSESH